MELHNFKIKGIILDALSPDLVLGCFCPSEKYDSYYQSRKEIKLDVFIPHSHVTLTGICKWILYIKIQVLKFVAKSRGFTGKNFQWSLAHH